jgi:hypothetical protein
MEKAVMRFASNKVWVFVSALALCPALSQGQSRTRYRWQDPQLRGIRTIGGSFGLESYGLGGLRAPSAGGVLESSLRRSTNFKLTRGAPSGLAPSPAARTFSRATGQQYGTPGLKLRGLADVVDGTGPSFGEEGTPSSGLEAYLQAMGRGSELRVEDSQPIKSFVPGEPSLYQKYMAEGDRRFRQGEYLRAEGQFEIALAFLRRIPEANLSLVHSKFARGRYGAGAYHLRQALTYFPELPLARISVRDFYGQDRKGDFDKHVEALEKRLAERGVGADHRLLMAYFYYFDGHEAEAIDALRKAAALSRRDKDESVQEAVKIFWDGLLAAGKVSAPLEGTTQPATLPGKVGGKPLPPAEAPTRKDKQVTPAPTGRPAP